MTKFHKLLTERRLTYLFTFLAAVILLLIPGFQDRFVRAVFAVSLFAFAFLFTVSYGVRGNWRESQVGKSLLYWTASTTVLSGYISVALLTRSDYPFSNEVGTLIYAGLAATVYLMYRQWWKINKGEPITGSSNDPHRSEAKLSRNQCPDGEDCDSEV